MRSADCDPNFGDTGSGDQVDHPGLIRALEHVREGDILVVWRLGRSLASPIELMTQLDRCGIGFKSVTE